MDAQACRLHLSAALQPLGHWLLGVSRVGKPKGGSQLRHTWAMETTASSLRERPPWNTWQDLILPGPSEMCTSSWGPQPVWSYGWFVGKLATKQCRQEKREYQLNKGLVLPTLPCIMTARCPHHDLVRYVLNRHRCSASCMLTPELELQVGCNPDCTSSLPLCKGAADAPRVGPAGCVAATAGTSEPATCRMA